MRSLISSRIYFCSCPRAWINSATSRRTFLESLSWDKAAASFRQLADMDAKRRTVPRLDSTGLSTRVHSTCGSEVFFPLVCEVSASFTRTKFFFFLLVQGNQSGTVISGRGLGRRNGERCSWAFLRLAWKRAATLYQFVLRTQHRECCTTLWKGY